MDSGELNKPVTAAALPVLHEKRKENSKKWGSSPEDSNKVLAAVAKFPSLHINKKLVCVTALSFASINYENTLKAARKERKEAQDSNKFRWTSNLYEEELEMIGDLDPNEAEKIYQEEIDQEERYVGQSFEVLLRDEEDNRILSNLDFTLLDEVKSASSYNNENFVDSKFCESDNEKEAERPILLDRERKKILKECKSYQMKTEWLMDNWVRKKTELILFDEGACSETKFN